MKFSPRFTFQNPSSFFRVGRLLTVAVLGCGCGHGARRTHPQTSLSAPDREMLQQYETIRALLARDDFRSAKRTAAGFQHASQTPAPADTKSPGADGEAAIAAANTLSAQRDAFRAWSAQVISLTKEVEGFYVIHCPLPNCGDWLQTDANVDNPFMGKAMHDCGEVEK